MKKIYKADQHGFSNRGWLQSHFHFSFAEYYNHTRNKFGVLRVLNDDLIKANRGFDMHPHKNMEIISYIVDGELSHADNMGNENTLGRGNVQYMSAGTGVKHSEYNLGVATARLLQIWILPDKDGYKPNYGDRQFDWELRRNKFLHLVSGMDGDAPIKIHQDANIYVIELDSDKEIEFELKQGRQLYATQIEGESKLDKLAFQEGDGLEVTDENLKIKAITKSHIMLIEMSKEI